MISDQMLLRAIRLAIDQDDIPEMRRLYSYDGSSAFLDEYIKWDDARFFLTFSDSHFSDKRFYELVDRLCKRRLLKQVYKKRIEELPEEARDILSRISTREKAEMRRRLETRVYETMRSQSALSPDSADYVIVHAYTTKSVRDQGINDLASILIDMRPQPRPFEEESLLFQSINERLSEAFIEVYAPVAYETVDDRQQLLNRLERPITDTLGAFREEAET